MKPDSEEGKSNNPTKSQRSFWVEVLYWISYLRIRFLSEKEGVRFLMLLDNRLYHLQGNAAVRYGNGLHPKHRYLKYHDFFVNRIGKNEKVLDVGCGMGVVSYSIALKSEAIVTGIDLNPENIKKAKMQFNHKNITYFVGDALTDLPNEKFDVVILSNVLEHIEKRVDFLKQLCLKVSPQRLLIRVPLFERDWRVPLKKELGIDYRLDSTHYTEYTHESFIEEMNDAGLRIAHLESRWGEIWAEVVPDGP